MFQLRPEGPHIFLVPSLHPPLPLGEERHGEMTSRGLLFRTLGLVVSNPWESLGCTAQPEVKGTYRMVEVTVLKGKDHTWAPARSDVLHVPEGHLIPDAACMHTRQ